MSACRKSYEMPFAVLLVYALVDVMWRGTLRQLASFPLAIGLLFAMAGLGAVGATSPSPPFLHPPPSFSLLPTSPSPLPPSPLPPSPPFSQPPPQAP
ncbi:unnamed protein product [Closterium sp. NIES-53]